MAVFRGLRAPRSAVDRQTSLRPGNCQGLNAAAAPARPARPSRASAPRRRTARSSRPTARPRAASANRLPLNSTIPTAKLHPATVAGPRRGSRPCASAMTATSAAACTMPYKEPVRSSSAVRGAASRCAASAPAATEARPASPAIASHIRVTCEAPLAQRGFVQRQRLGGDPLLGELALDEAPPGPAHRAPPLRVAGQHRDRVGQRRDIARRDEQPGLFPRLARPHDLAASRHVAGDDRPPAGRGFEQRFRQPLAIGGRQHRDRGLGPDLAHVLDPAEPHRRPARRRAPPAPGRRANRGLSGSVGPASTSSTASPSARSRRTEATASGTPLLRSMRPTSATLMLGPPGFATGSGSGAKCAVSTPEPRIRTRRGRSIPSRASASRSSGFCTMMRASPAACRNPRAQRRAGQPRHPARGGKPGTEPVDGGNAGRPLGPAREGEKQRGGAEQHRLQRDMMHDIGPLAPVQRGDRRHGAAGADNAVAAPPPAQRLEPKPLVADPVAMHALARRDDDFEPGIPRRPRNRQPVRPEIPILGDQKEQLRPPVRAAAATVGASRAYRAERWRLRARQGSEPSAGGAPPVLFGALPTGRKLFNPSPAPPLAETAERTVCWRASWLPAPAALSAAPCARRSPRAATISSPGCAVRSRQPRSAPKSLLLGDIAPGRDWKRCAARPRQRRPSGAARARPAVAERSGSRA